jgi:hypothetical protein
LKRERYRLLKWFFEFAYVDFEQMTDAAVDDTRAKLNALLALGMWNRPDDEVIRNLTLYYLAWLDVGREIDHGHSAVEIETLKAYQASFRQVFNSLMDSIATLPGNDTDTKITAPADNSGSLGPCHVLTQHFMPAAVLQAQITTMLPQESSSKKYPSGTTRATEIFDMIGVPAGVQIFTKGWKENVRIVVTAPHTDPAALLGAIFLRELNGVPLNIFHQCKGCKHWFIHASARQHQFCTNRCAARYLMRVSRANVKATQPERYKAEKESGKKRARKSYRKKHGLPIKNIKVKLDMERINEPEDVAKTKTR